MEHINEETRQQIVNDLYGARDMAFWAEDAAGIEGDSEEKKIIDAALDALAACRQKVIK